MLESGKQCLQFVTGRRWRTRTLGTDGCILIKTWKLRRKAKQWGKAPAAGLTGLPGWLQNDARSLPEACESGGQQCAIK